MTPLSQFALFHTRDPDHARELVARSFCAHRLEPLAEHDAFDARHHLARGAMIAINYLHYGATVLIDPQELQDFYLIQIPVSGAARITNGSSTFLSDRNTGTILNPDRRTRMIWLAGCEQFLVYVSRKVLSRFAEAVISRSLSTPIVFEPQISFARPDAELWRRKVCALYGAAEEGRLFVSDSALDQRLLEEALLSEFLAMQPSNISQFMNEPVTALNAGYVKRARSFIVENAAKPIGMSDIAEAAGVSIRTLQYAFTRNLTRTPVEVLRRERLMRIRQELASGHCEMTVAHIASNWGMTHFGRFSRYYEREFGELPSKTKKLANDARLV
ncbi:AraC family transcriptional regulator [Hoeflea prorocentri]|uniref:AraC family transcriptional regulator n=1 Tax=Hoeflea prorocentri TaxID=1922333 RepID=A0A9X3UHP1_9HYPH|nr:AraC family transcriptional regulator [Hoeflea prorocentri]MCY6381010.1 AraC family transcriptional regulator [Hoeflea prorocentri]MDA5398810.1 AraC family transcriptional regulator [Hoeflea prorocentri]